MKIDNNTMYRCIHGNWSITSIRRTWDNTQEGFCPSPTQCLVDNNGNANNNNLPLTYKGSFYTSNPQCIETEQFIEDHICNNGSWSTRTKSLATELLALADSRGNQNDYAILCANYTSTLNRFEYLTAEGIKIENYIKVKYYEMGPLSRYTCSDDPLYLVPCVNNICILRYQDRFDDEEKIIAAASLNNAVDLTELSFLKTLDKDSTYCDSLIGTNSDFQKCSNDNTIWYSDKLNTLIFSKQGINLAPPSFLESFLNLFVNPIHSLLSFINPVAINVIPIVYEAQDYNNIYANVLGNKAITATFEPAAENPFLAAKYTGFNQDICLAIERYDIAKFDSSGIISCNQSGNQFFVGLWDDLTTKLRIS
jgi:hypothetical protein